MIEFCSRTEEARFLSPLLGGELATQQLEIRTDPLLGHQAVFNPDLEGKESILFPDTDQAYLRERAAATEASCFLCDGRWEHTTPRYPAEILPDGRLVRGEAVLFPNLFPLGAVHAVVMVGARHLRTLDDFPPDLLADAFAVSVDFVRRCHAARPEVTHYTINANYLFPAGASVVHPHLQILGSPAPGTHHARLLERSAAHAAATGGDFWTDLVASERELGARWIGERDGAAWFTAYAPLGPHEVLAVWPAATDFGCCGDGELAGLAAGLSATLAAYHDLGLSTFNFSLYSGPLDATAPGFRCVLRLVNRQNVVPDHRTDDYYFQKLLHNEIILRRPEALAELIRPRFAGAS